MNSCICDLLAHALIAVNNIHEIGHRCGVTSLSQKSEESIKGWLQLLSNTLHNHQTAPLSLSNHLKMPWDCKTAMQQWGSVSAPGIFFDPCPTGGLLGGALRGRT